MGDQISNKTIIVLLILAIVISVIATWTTIEYLNTEQQIAPQQEIMPEKITTDNSGGLVSLSIQRSGADQDK